MNNIARQDTIANGSLMVSYVRADVLQTFAMSREVVREDAWPTEWLYQFELHVALPRKRVSEREFDTFTAIDHVL